MRGTSPTPCAGFNAAHGRDERIAILRGLWDGATGRLGKNPRFVRQVGELSGAET